MADMSIRDQVNAWAEKRLQDVANKEHAYWKLEELALTPFKKLSTLQLTGGIKYSKKHNEAHPDDRMLYHPDIRAVGASSLFEQLFPDVTRGFIDPDTPDGSEYINRLIASRKKPAQDAKSKESVYSDLENYDTIVQAMVKDSKEKADVSIYKQRLAHLKNEEKQKQKQKVAAKKVAAPKKAAAKKAAPADKAKSADAQRRADKAA